MSSSTFQTPSRDSAAALHSIDQAGFQAPSAIRLKTIIEYARIVALLRAGALREPSRSELDEIFQDFVVRCVNRPPRIADAVDEHASALNSLGSNRSLR